MAPRKNDRVHVRMDATLKQRVQLYCAQRHTTVSELVVQLLLEFLEAQNVEEEQV